LRDHDECGESEDANQMWGEAGPRFGHVVSGARRGEREFYRRGPALRSRPCQDGENFW
jgi:hypothetical protein